MALTDGLGSIFVEVVFALLRFEISTEYRVDQNNRSGCNPARKGPQNDVIGPHGVGRDSRHRYKQKYYHKWA